MDTALTLPPGGEPAATLDGIMALERALMAWEGQHGAVEYPTTHWLTGELYARRLCVPADTVFTTYVHKTRNMAILVQGHATVVAQDGSRRDIHAPEVWITEPGTKRAIYAHDDLIWVTVHPCAAKELEDAEAEVFATASTVEDYHRVMALLAAPETEEA